MKIKERLANQRKAINKTQAQMADEIGISLTSYKKYESGEGLPTMENLVKSQMLWRSQLMNYAEDGPQMKIKSLCSG